jgi:hypothetical protein
MCKNLPNAIGKRFLFRKLPLFHRYQRRLTNEPTFSGQMDTNQLLKHVDRYTHPVRRNGYAAGGHTCVQFSSKIIPSQNTIDFVLKQIIPIMS